MVKGKGISGLSIKWKITKNNLWKKNLMVSKITSK